MEKSSIRVYCRAGVSVARPLDPAQRVRRLRPTHFALGAAFLLAATQGLAAEPRGAAVPFEIFGEYRIRHEGYSQPIGLPQKTYEEVLASRLFLNLRIGGPGLHVRSELQDARGFLDTEETRVGTHLSNAMEPLQAYLGWDASGVLTPMGRLELKAGRLTINAGSRRLVARNRFRNTVNSFTGISAEWFDPGEGVVPFNFRQWVDAKTRLAQFFLVMPKDRLPLEREPLRQDDFALDAERLSTVLAGLRLKHGLPGDVSGEAYVYALSENDAEDFQTLDRRLVTPGLRLLRIPAEGQFDFEFEAALQLGESRASTSPRDRRDLTHRAGLVHTTLGYTPVAWPALRIAAGIDYVTGDGDPNDDTQERFDPLYGARRFEFGPTGQFGLVHRRNLLSPFQLTEWRPNPHTLLFVKWRGVWLASEGDIFWTTRQRDPSSTAGRFVAHQVEVVGKRFIGERFLIDGGVVFVPQGAFLRRTAGATAEALSTYTYFAVTIFFGDPAIRETRPVGPGSGVR